MGDTDRLDQVLDRAGFFDIEIEPGAAFRPGQEVIQFSMEANVYKFGLLHGTARLDPALVSVID
jgi:hypothetical protein